MQVLSEIGGKGVKNLQQNHISAMVTKSPPSGGEQYPLADGFVFEHFSIKCILM